MGEPDIGITFPNTDARWRGAPSKVFLQEVGRRVGFHDGRIVNIDATVIAERQRLPRTSRT